MAPLGRPCGSTDLRRSAGWRRYRRGAGPIRNREMAADAVAVFPGVWGTRNMRAEAHRAGKRLFDFMGKAGVAAGAPGK